MIHGRRAGQSHAVRVAPRDRATNRKCFERRSRLGREADVISGLDGRVIDVRSDFIVNDIRRDSRRDRHAGFIGTDFFIRRRSACDSKCPDETFGQCRQRQISAGSEGTAGAQNGIIDRISNVRLGSPVDQIESERSPDTHFLRSRQRTSHRDDIRRVGRAQCCIADDVDNRLPTDFRDRRVVHFVDDCHADEGEIFGLSTRSPNGHTKHLVIGGDIEFVGEELRLVLNRRTDIVAVDERVRSDTNRPLGLATRTVETVKSWRRPFGEAFRRCACFSFLALPCRLDFLDRVVFPCAEVGTGLEATSDRRSLEVATQIDRFVLTEGRDRDILISRAETRILIDFGSGANLCSSVLSQEDDGHRSGDCRRFHAACRRLRPHIDQVVVEAKVAVDERRQGAEESQPCFGSERHVQPTVPIRVVFDSQVGLAAVRADVAIDLPRLSTRRVAFLNLDSVAAIQNFDSAARVIFRNCLSEGGHEIGEVRRGGIKRILGRGLQRDRSARVDLGIPRDVSLAAVVVVSDRCRDRDTNLRRSEKDIILVHFERLGSTGRSESQFLRGGEVDQRRGCNIRTNVDIGTDVDKPSGGEGGHIGCVAISDPGNRIR